MLFYNCNIFNRNRFKGTSMKKSSLHFGIASLLWITCSSLLYAAASSSSSLPAKRFRAENLLHFATKSEFLHQLNEIRTQHPDINNPRTILAMIVEKLQYRAHLNLSVQDLIEHNLIPPISENMLILDDMYIGDLTGIERIPDIASVTVLSLRKNNLEFINDHQFDGFKNLEDLDLRNNMLQKIAPRAFRNLSKLKRIDIGINRLTSLPTTLFAHLNNLEEVYLNNNKLETIDRETFADLAAIAWIDLSHNKLNHIAPHAFYNLPLLETVDLDHNQLQTLAPETFFNIRSANKIDLSFNHITDVNPLILAKELLAFRTVLLDPQGPLRRPAIVHDLPEIIPPSAERVSSEETFAKRQRR
jgi:Leucine-rich repeat (LRR) protein